MAGGKKVLNGIMAFYTKKHRTDGKQILLLRRDGPIENEHDIVRKITNHLPEVRKFK